MYRRILMAVSLTIFATISLAQEDPTDANTLDGLDSSEFINTLSTAQIKLGPLTVGEGGLLAHLAFTNTIVNGVNSHWGIYAHGPSGGAWFKDSDSTGEATLGNHNYGITAVGSQAGGYFKDSDNSGEATLGNGNYGITAVGSQAGGYFKHSTGSSSAYLGKSHWGVEGLGTWGGGHFVDTDSGGEGFVGRQGHGIYALGPDSGGYFKDTDGLSEAWIAQGDYGLMAHGHALVQGTEGFDSAGEEGTIYLGTTHHYIKATYGLGVKIGTYGVGDAVSIKELTGNVGIGTTDPTERLEIIGTTKTSVLEITGGSDLSEQFHIRASDHDVLPSPGMVVTIDPDNSGALVISKEAYDRRVAGIISGGGGMHPGVLMGRRTSETDGTTPVALTGRVYCHATAANGSIRPGDLLTTSDVPGHAMKATSRELSPGAILGKAMSSLEIGNGYVLVLVSLQ